MWLRVLLKSSLRLTCPSRQSFFPCPPPCWSSISFQIAHLLSFIFLPSVSFLSFIEINFRSTWLPLFLPLSFLILETIVSLFTVGRLGRHCFFPCPPHCWSSLSPQPSSSLDCSSQGFTNMPDVQARNSWNHSIVPCKLEKEIEKIWYQCFRIDRRGETWQMFAQVVHAHWKVCPAKNGPIKSMAQ